MKQIKTSQSFMRSTFGMAFIGMILLLTTIMLFQGCKRKPVTGENKKTEECLKTTDPTSLPTIKTKDIPVRDCPDIFPESREMYYNMTLVSDSSTIPMKFQLSFDCHYDLTYFDECCRCKAMLNYLELEGAINDGETVIVSVPGSTLNSYSNQDLTLQGGQIDLKGNGMDVELEDGLELIVEVPGIGADQLSVKAGGLVVVVNIDGGGN